MKYGYASGFNPEEEARAVGKDLSISTKQSIEICNLIRGKPLENAKKILEEVMVLKKAVPYKRFNSDVGHKRGKIAAGRYPVNASKAILSILNLAEANAHNKGLTGNLKLRHIAAQKASRPVRYGRRRGLEARRTHIEVIVSEVEKKEGKQPKKEEKAVEKKEEAKPEPKKEVKAEKKPEEKKDNTPKIDDIQKEKKKEEEKKQKAKPEPKKEKTEVKK